jgi:hypothetical protein
MSTRSSSSSSTVLVIIILVLTFPLWLGLGGALIGVVAGLFGAMIGVVAALFGGIIALIALPFKLIFGWGDWSCDWPGFHGNGFVWLALLIFAALIINKRKK